jgi:hypothetical protein
MVKEQVIQFVVVNKKEVQVNDLKMHVVGQELIERVLMLDPLTLDPLILVQAILESKDDSSGIKWFLRIRHCKW